MKINLIKILMDNVMKLNLKYIKYAGKIIHGPKQEQC